MYSSEYTSGFSWPAASHLTAPPSPRHERHVRQAPSSHSTRPAPLYQKTDHWFQRATAALLGEVPCRLGCTSCCIGPFPITLLDVHTLQQGLAGLPPDHRHRIEQRAIEQTAAMEAAFPQLTHTDLLDNWSDQEINRLVTEFHHHPCPALEANGRCGVYHHRPLVCRSMGIPTEDRGLAHGACEVQTFTPILRLPSAFREEEDRLAQEEATSLDTFRQATGSTGEEVFLPYGFLDRETRETCEKNGTGEAV